MCVFADINRIISFLGIKDGYSPCAESYLHDLHEQLSWCGVMAKKYIIYIVHVVFVLIVYLANDLWIYVKQLNSHSEDKLAVIPPVHHDWNDSHKYSNMHKCIFSITLCSATTFSPLCNLSVNWITSSKSLCVFAHR